MSADRFEDEYRGVTDRIERLREILDQIANAAPGKPITS